MDMATVTHEISRRGWHEIELPVTEDLRGIVPLLRPELANRLEALHLERVSPKQASDARAGTMSSRWGLAAFPLHTERAHWRVPPRFLILRSVGEATDRPTTLVDSAGLRLDRRLRRELLTTDWRVGMGTAEFSTTVLWRADTDRMDHIRYDRCCMAPTVTVGDRFSSVLEAADVVEHLWRPGTALVIDNWRMLHGRGTSDLIDYGRIIERVVVP